MKKLIVFIALIPVALTVFCQDTGHVYTKEDYLQKSKEQKTAAWILLGGGAAATIGGLIWFGNEFQLFESNTGTGGAVLTLVGIGAMGGCIPLFVASRRNKNKATLVTGNFKLERQWLVNQNSFSNQNYPAFSVCLHLK